MIAKNFPVPLRKNIIRKPKKVFDANANELHIVTQSIIMPKFPIIMNTKY